MPRPSGSARGYVARLIVGLILVTAVACAQEKRMKLALSSEPTEEIKEGQVLLQNRGLFLRAGAGLALYQNNRPGESNGSGWSWTAGVGYEIPLTENFALAPIVDYAAGSLGDVRNIITVETGRHYSVVEFKAAIIWHFGKPN